MFWRAFQQTLIVFILLFLGSGALPPPDGAGQVRRYTRALEFDFVTWTLDALDLKLRQAAQGGSTYLDEDEGGELVREYLELIHQLESAERDLATLHADPEVESLGAEIAAVNSQLEAHYAQREALAPLVEAILQEQLAVILDDFGLTLAGQPIPPVLFHSTPLPWALIVSPRAAIEQQANISLDTEMGLAEQIALEDEVAGSLDVATLVVPVGGIGSYPTMIAQSSNLNWLAEVIAHEWIHNYLTLRPLGLLYNRDQDLRTMNETVANIAGKELGAALIERYYPELAPPPPAPPSETAPEPNLQEPPTFDFRAEMHTTRIQVDALLAEGQIEEAEAYMLARREVFWEHGYPIRKLNQAYFAFYGSYADQPTGPAGEDPIGAAVRELRAQSPTLKSFVGRMAFLTSFEALQAELAAMND